jgi:hypothetical protein
MAKPILLFIMSLVALIWAPAATAQMATLDSYVREGLAGNLALQQQNVYYEKASKPCAKHADCFCPHSL